MLELVIFIVVVAFCVSAVGMLIQTVKHAFANPVSAVIALAIGAAIGIIGYYGLIAIVNNAISKI